MVACLPLVQRVSGSIPGKVVNFHLKIFNLMARRGGDIHFLITRLYKVDRTKRHHASMKPVGEESISALGFYDPATFRFQFQYCVHCSWVEPWVYEFSIMKYSIERRIIICTLSWKNLRGESVAGSSVNFPILLCHISQSYRDL